MSTTTGAAVRQASFPTSTTGLDQARTWIMNRAGERTVLVVIEGIGSYGAGLAQRLLAAGLPVVEPSSMAAADRRGTGKTDALDGSTHR